VKKSTVVIRVYLVLLLLSLAVDVNLFSIKALGVESLPLNLITTMVGAVFPLVYFQDVWRFIRENKCLLGCLAVFLGCGAISALLSPFGMMVGLKWLFNYARFIGVSGLLFFLVWRDRDLGVFFLRALVVLALALALVSFVEVSHDGFCGFLADAFRNGERQVFNGWARTAATLPHPNTFGCFMAIGILVLLHLRERDTMPGGLFITCLVLLSLALGLSSSRNAVIALMLPTGLLVFNRRRFKMRVVTLLIPLLAIAIMTPAGPRLAKLIKANRSIGQTVLNPKPSQLVADDQPTGQATPEQTIKQATTGKTNPAASSAPPPPEPPVKKAPPKINMLELRIMLWQSALAIFREHPFFGIGPGGYNRALKDYAPAQLLEIEHEKIRHNYLNAHNGPLNILAEFGLAGAGCVLFLILFRLSRLIRGDGLLPPSAAHAALLAIALSFMPDAFFYNQFYMVLSLTLFLIFTQPGKSQCSGAPVLTKPRKPDCGLSA
jgi:hypothetical protein